MTNKRKKFKLYLRKQKKNRYLTNSKLLAQDIVQEIYTKNQKGK